MRKELEILQPLVGNARAEEGRILLVGHVIFSDRKRKSYPDIFLLLIGMPDRTFR